MKRLSSLVALAALLVALVQPGAAVGVEVRKLTLTQAIDAAVSDNPELAIASRSIGVADQRVRSAKALRLPKLSISANAQYWFDDLGISFAPPGTPPEMAPPPVIVRESLTTSVGVNLVQPLSGLAVIGRLIGIEQAGVDVAKSELSGAKLDIASKTAELYLRIMQARAGVQIAEQSLAQIDAQIERARALEKAGVLGKVDLMRLESARSEVAQRALAARDGVAGATDALALLLGLPGGTTLETVDDLPKDLPAPPWDEQQAVAVALQKRPELRTADLRARQAEGAVDVQRANWYPNVAAIANYTRTDGQAFAEENAYFVGVTATWDIWDWGKRSADVAEARGRAAQAKMAANRQRDQVTLDVRGKLRIATTTREQLGVAEKGLATAEEAYRITSVRFQGGDATTLDVLDAETDVARARLAYTNYRYEYAIALIQLARAIGEQPLAAFQLQTK